MKQNDGTSSFTALHAEHRVYVSSGAASVGERTVVVEEQDGLIRRVVARREVIRLRLKNQIQDFHLGCFSQHVSETRPFPLHADPKDLIGRSVHDLRAESDEVRLSQPAALQALLAGYATQPSAYRPIIVT